MEDSEAAHRKVRELMQVCALQALMASHPDPHALRAAWAVEMAHLWPGAMKAFQGANPMADYLRQQQETWESLIPAPPAA
ncbi:MULTISPECIES: hypothetical protein [Xanthomonas]|uniref:Uncharacterized protein n=1 Tax=Xanthomonas dyei TaxID=743699 RepID=A0ABZ0D3K4_9XANT|nr:hypothetical protein [Xanthomonas dyei]WOB24773.1 hypothetical protein NYR99_13285 [Xanthomonas dyei]WOB52401.1 hypothetical protein NYR95_13290 [Xanthomonas dyei]